MPIMVKAPKGGDFVPAPEGLHRAVCVDVWEPWTEENPRFPGKDGKPKVQTKTRLVFLLDAQMPDGRPFEIAPKYTLSLHEKSSLRRDLESWRGRAFTDEECEGFDLETVIGVNCQIQVIHKKGSQGGTFANVAGIMPLARGQAKLSIPSSYVRHKDREPKADQDEPWQADDSDLPFSLAAFLPYVLPALSCAWMLA
jgi:hypothetical protein